MNKEEYLITMMEDIKSDIKELNNKIDKIQTETIPHIKIEAAKTGVQQKGIMAAISLFVSVLVHWASNLF